MGRLPPRKELTEANQYAHTGLLEHAYRDRRHQRRDQHLAAFKEIVERFFEEKLSRLLQKVLERNYRTLRDILRWDQQNSFTSCQLTNVA